MRWEVISIQRSECCGQEISRVGVDAKERRCEVEEKNAKEG